MKVLITGGYGFIGSHTAERFFKEGHEIYIIDNLSSGEKKNLTIKHKFYELDVQDEKCEEVFASNLFDVVVHLAAQVDVAVSLKDPPHSAETNIIGLINMLHFSWKYRISKFIFASSAAVYGDNPDLPLTEEYELHPISPYGENKHLGEEYCELWKLIHNLDYTCLRFSNVYGPRQGAKGEGGVISIFLRNAIEGRTFKVFGNGEQTRDFIYVGDVVDGLYRAAQSTTNEIINLSTNSQISLLELIETIEGIHGEVEKEFLPPREGDILHSRLSNDLAAETLEWVPIFNLEDGLKKAYKWFKKKYSEEEEEEILDNEFVKRKKTIKDLKAFVKGMLPYAENLAVFCLVLFLTFYVNYQNIGVNVDFKLLYIITISMHYGLKQGSFSIILSCLLYIYEIRTPGQSLISIIYNEDTLINFSTYIFMGSLLGYSINTRIHAVKEKEYEMAKVEEKFGFLYDLYNESKEVRLELQDQILSSEDSFLKIFNVTDRLNTLKPDEVFDKAVHVIEEIIKSKDVVIFAVSSNQYYLRMMAKSKGCCEEVSKSIRVETFEPAQIVISEKEIFVNKGLVHDWPMMISPVVVNDSAVALICIYAMDFESISLYKQNLLKTVAALVKTALGKAYQYEEAIRHKKYINETNVLKAEYFTEILVSKIKAREVNHTEFTVLKVTEPKWEENELHLTAAGSIRDFDYLGVNETNELLLLLTNTGPKEADMVIKRFGEKGLPVINITEESVKDR